MSIDTSFPPYTKVFAKVPGFPYWPGAIIPPEKYPHSITSGTEKQLGVLFYGSMDYSLVRMDLLKDFQSVFNDHAGTKRKDLQKAISHALEVSPKDLIDLHLLPTESNYTPILVKPDPVPSLDIIESPKRSTNTSRKSRRKRVFHKDLDKMLKVKSYLAHRIYGEHNLVVNIVKIDKMICWLSSLTDINYKLIEESRIGHVLSYIALKPPDNQIGEALKSISIPKKCQALIEQWKIHLIENDDSAVNLPP